MTTPEIPPGLTDRRQTPDRRQAPQEIETSERRGEKTERRETLAMNILLAEDDDSVSGLFVRVLKSLGCTVTLVKDGQALLDELADKTKKYDLVITDNTMPKVKGIDALQRIREDALFEHTKDVKVILDSSDQDGTLEGRVRGFGGVFLPKPVSPPNLSAAVKKIYYESIENAAPQEGSSA